PAVIAPIADVTPPVQVVSTGLPSSTTVDQDAPSPSKSQTTPETQSSIITQDVKEYIHDIEVTYMRNDPLFGVPILKVTSAQSSSTVVKIVLWYLDSGCSKHMTGDCSQLINFALKTKSWIWHRRLSHLNFGAINHLARQGLVRGLPKIKFEKEHLCSACAMGKSKKKSHKPKSEDTNQEKLYLLHIDLYGTIRVKSVNGKKLASLMKHQLLALHSKMVSLKDAIAEAMATACYTQNRSIIRLHHGKTPYELLHNKLPDLSFLHVFGALCYPTNFIENLGKLQPKADIRIFIDFDELTAMASEQSSSGPALNEMTPATISSGLVQKPSSSTPYVRPSRNDWDLLFQPVFDELLTPPPSVDHQAPEVLAPIADVIPPIHAESNGKAEGLGPSYLYRQWN
nr:hypothetical protein [Tanacetum cinerariifolium]